MKDRIIIKGDKPVPQFDSIEAESDFWDTHDPFEYGTWVEVTPEELDHACASHDLHEHSIQIEPALLGRLEAIAADHQIDLNTLIRLALWRYVRAAK